MCGIVGIIKPRRCATVIENKLEDTFKDLLLVDQLRGEDSTGVFAMRHSHGADTKYTKNIPTVATIKRPQPASEFLKLQKLREMIFTPWYSYKFVVGHNRLATWGKYNLTESTAHPFHYGNTIMCHNGTLTNFTQIAEFASNGKETFEIDSQAFAYAIEHKGLQAALDNLRGTYSIVYMNLEDGTLNFIRNYGRPMWFAFLEQNEGLVFASEKYMLHWVAKRRKLDVKNYIEPQPHHHIKIEPNTGKFEVNKLTVKSPTIYAPRNNQRNDWPHNQGGEGGVNQALWQRMRQEQNQRQGAFANLSKKQKKTRLQINRTLREAGLGGIAVGTLIDFWYSEFEPYEKKKKGKVFGNMYATLAGTPHTNVMVPNVPKEVMARYLEKDKESLSTFNGEVINLAKAKKDTFGPTLIVSWKTVSHIAQERTIDYTQYPHGGHPLADEKNNNPDTDSSPEKEWCTDEMFDEILELNEQFYGPEEVLISKEEMVKALENGCCLCFENIDPEDHLVIGWNDLEQPICAPCVRIPENHQFVKFEPINPLL